MDARSHGMDVSRQNNYATKADWERYRNEITLLYEGKELKVVKRFMEKEYQFKATSVRCLYFSFLLLLADFLSETRCIKLILKSGV